jgi:hypothetical protein
MPEGVGDEPQVPILEIPDPEGSAVGIKLASRAPDKRIQGGAMS